MNKLIELISTLGILLLGGIVVGWFIFEFTKPSPSIITVNHDGEVYSTITNEKIDDMYISVVYTTGGAESRSNKLNQWIINNQDREIVSVSVMDTGYMLIVHKRKDITCE